MASDDSSASAVLPPPRRARGRGLLWLVVLALIAAAGWKLYPWWQAHVQPSAAPVATEESAVGDTGAAIMALRREQHDLAQRMSDATSSTQVLRDEVLGVGERAALLEQSVARIASPRAQGEQALRLDEAELLLTIGEQQVELSSDVASALHAYALADGTLAGSTDPAALNLRQSLAQEIAALHALPADPRGDIAGKLDVLEASLDTPPFAVSTPTATAGTRPSVFDRVVGSVVEVRRAPAQDLLDPASREAAVTAVRLELTIARLALERRDPTGFDAALARIDRWLPRLYAPGTVASQRRMLADLRHAPLRIESPALGGTLAELRRLRQQQPEPVAPTPAAGPPATPPGAPAAAPPAKPLP
jgi:uroporphyrin-3 C-methyltransferase